MVTVILSVQMHTNLPSQIFRFTLLVTHGPSPIPVLLLSQAAAPGHAKLPGDFVIGTNGDGDETTQLAFIYRLSQDVSPSLQKKKPTVLTHCAT